MCYTTSSNLTIVQPGKMFRTAHTADVARDYDLHEVNCHVGRCHVQCSRAQFLRFQSNAARSWSIGSRLGDATLVSGLLCTSPGRVALTARAR